MATLRDAGGQVLFDDQWRDGRAVTGSNSWFPRIRDLIGEDYFRQVTFVDLGRATGGSPVELLLP